ncbi:MAG: ABC transporter permease/substrate-binding protein [Sphingobium sp.]
MTEAFATLPQLLRAHLLLSAAAIGLAILIGLPLALWAARHPRKAAPVMALVSVVQTVPALALLALFYPLLLALGRASGLAIPALGFLPALLALALYALLPIMRNGVAALTRIDPAILEAADGVGMTAWQKLRLVEAPLAMPVVVAGIRTASVWTIGAATLATTVGQASLGNLIFAGLQTEDWTRVLVGCVAAAGLALIVDGLFVLVESGVRKRVRWRLWLGGVALAAGLVAALTGGPSGERTAVVGAKNFTEQYILAALIADRLGGAEQRTGLGSAVAYRALAGSDIDVYVDYAGTLWTNVLRRTDSPPAPEMIATLGRELKARDGVRLVGALGFENAYAFAMRRDRAKALGIATLADLARRAPALRFGTDLEFTDRPEWRAVEQAYGLRFASRTSYSPTFMYRAVGDGTVDVISAFSSDGRIAAQDLVILTDPKAALPRYDAVLLVSPARADDPAFLTRLRPLVGAIPVEAMRGANLMVDRDDDKRSPEEAARTLAR